MLIFALTLCFVPLGFAAGRNRQSAPKRGHPPAAQPAAAYNPYRAVHDVEVGKFYLKRGDVDAAISRFKDAMLYKDNYAEPRLLLGECYEKKNDPATAIRYYQEYLKILPDSPESKKVRERIERLQEKLKSAASPARR